MSERHSNGDRSLFPDVDLVTYVREMYGPAMALRLEEILTLDSENRTGFARSIRRSVTHEIAQRTADPSAITLDPDALPDGELARIRREVPRG